MPRKVIMRGRNVVAAPHSAVRSASREMRQRFADHENHTVSFGERIGGGQQGSVFRATIAFAPNLFIEEISCVAKLADGKLPSASEFETHETITASSQLPSSESGVLTSIGIHTTNGTPYLLLPSCDLMLSECLHDLQELRLSQDPEKKLLFDALMLAFFKSMV